MTTDQKQKQTEEKKREKNTHKLPPKMGGLGGGVWWGNYLHKNTIILVDQLYASLQIIIRSLPTVK